MKKPGRRVLAEEYLVLKIVITLLPVSLLLLYLPRHRSIGLSLGLSLGIGLSQIVPPRKSLRQVLIWIAIAVLIGLATAAFPMLTW